VETGSIPWVINLSKILGVAGRLHVTLKLLTFEDLHFFGLRLRYAILLAAGVIVFLSWIVRFFARIVSARVMAGVPNCPGCASTSSTKTFAKGVRDAVFGLFGCSPYRCGACGYRYFRAG
jgi:hypothetical protein